MAQVLIRQIEDDVVARLKARAARNGRSLESELRAVLVEASSDVREEIDAVRKLFGPKRLPDSSELVRG